MFFKILEYFQPLKIATGSGATLFHRPFSNLKKGWRLIPENYFRKFPPLK
jgi:hypothetical protein